MRAPGKDPMRRHFDPDAVSNRKPGGTQNPLHSTSPVRSDTKFELLKDLRAFMKVRKKYWIASVILVLVLLGAPLVPTKGSAVVPYICTFS